jgi:NTE family protein
MDAMLLGDYLHSAPFTCTLSAGFFGFYAHTGFLIGLERAGLAPTSFTGASAGALVAGVAASGTSLDVLRRDLLAVRRHDFWDPKPGLGLLRGDLFQRRVASMLTCTTMDACPRPVAISVFSLRTRTTVVVRSGDLAWAIRASCSFPLLLQPAARDGMRYIDGGVLDRAGLDGADAGDRRLFHHLISSSPWRRPSQPSAQIPARPNLLAFAIRGLPRSGPFALAEGRRALVMAEEATLRALDRPLPVLPYASGTVRILTDA